MKKKERTQPPRINIQLLTPEQQDLYRQLKIIAATEEIYLKTLVLELLTHGVKEWRLRK